MTVGFSSLSARRHRRPAMALRAARSLRIETLENRMLLAVDAAWYGQVSSQWFETLQPSVNAAQGAASIAANGQSEAGVSAASDEWMVRLTAEALTETTSVADAAAFLEADGLRFEILEGLGLPGQLLVRASGGGHDAVAAALAANQHLAYFEPNGVVSTNGFPNDPLFSQLYGLHNTRQTGGFLNVDINAPAAWERGVGSRDVVVAVIDSGIDYSHVDLAPNIWTNPREIAGNGLDDDGNGFIDDVHGYDFANNDGDPADDNFHGTHVAGIIGALGNNNIGGAGVNWETSMMAIKFLGASGFGSFSNGVRAVNYVTMMRRDHGVNVRVINASYGSNFLSKSEQDAVGATREAGILFVAAAGNEGRSNDTIPAYPATFDFDNIISVAATDSRDALAVFSNVGRTSVDLSAPGVGIVSTRQGNRYGNSSGTSFAAPYVAGVAALAWSLAPDASYQQIRDAIYDSVTPIPALKRLMVTGGRLNAQGALTSLLGSQALFAPDIEVHGGGLVINDGSVTPVAANQTDFGAHKVNGEQATHTFTIFNRGNSVLNLVGDPSIQLSGPHASEFSLLLPAVQSLAPGASTTFSVTFDPNSGGVRRASINIANNDPDENPYDFAIQGVGIASAWQNPRDRLDVNNDGVVSGLDALILINELNRNGARMLPNPPLPPDAPPPFYDVNGDDGISPQDALTVINFINNRPSTFAAAAQPDPVMAAASSPAPVASLEPVAAPAPVVIEALNVAASSPTGSRIESGRHVDREAATMDREFTSSLVEPPVASPAARIYPDDLSVGDARDVESLIEELAADVRGVLESENPLDRVWASLV